MFGRGRKRKEKHIAPELLSAYLDGQVTPQECARVEQHLRACAACAHELEMLRYTTRLLRAVPRVSLPRAFTLSEADVRQTAARYRARRFSLYLQGATALVAAMLLVVMVGDVLLGPQRVGAPQPLVMEKAVVETTVVEAEREVRLEVTEEARVVEKVVEVEEEKVVEVEKPVAVPLTSVAATVEAEATKVVEKPAELQMRALAVTPEGAPQAPAEVQPEAGVRAPAAEATAVALRAAEALEEVATPPAPARPSVVPSPEAKPAETTVAIVPTPTPVPTPLPRLVTPAPPETAAAPVVWGNLPRLAEIILASLLIVLLGLSIWVSRRR